MWFTAEAAENEEFGIVFPIALFAPLREIFRFLVATLLCCVSAVKNSSVNFRR